MFIRYLLIPIVVVVNLNAYANAISRETICKRIEKLPKEAEDFYTKFKDIKSTLLLFQGLGGALDNKITRDRMTCLKPQSYDKVLKSYAKFLAIKGDENILKFLAKENPSKIFFYKYLASLYRDKYLSKDRIYSFRKYEYRAKALEQYRKFVKLGGVLSKEKKYFVETNGLKKANNRWLDRYKIDNIPVNNYRVLYFDSKNPNDIVREDIVPYPAAKYEYKNKHFARNHDIPAKRFGALWVGKVVFEKDITKLISVQVINSAEYRIIVDGYELAKGKNSEVNFPFLFTKGEHQIEVEYLSHYDYVNIMVSIKDQYQSLGNSKKIKETFQRYGDYYLFYVGAYYAANFDMSTGIDLKKNYDKPIVLILNSNSSINWTLHTHDNQIKALFISGDHNRGSFVSFDDDSHQIDPKNIFRLINFYGPHKLQQKCKCYNGRVSCDGESIIDFSKKALELFGKSISGYTAGHSEDGTYNVPQVFLDEKTMETIKRKELKISKLKEKCKKKKQVGIDELFDK